MPITSLYPKIDIPQTNVLTYLFGDGQNASADPLWIDSKNPQKSLSPKQALQWIKRLGYGLQRLGLQRGDVVMICTPNHVFVPVSYLGIVGSGCIFSGANPIFTVPELVHQLSNTTAKAVLAHPSVLPSILEAAAKVGIPKDRIFQFSDEQNPVRQGVADWSAMLAAPSEAGDWKWPEFSPEEATTTIATINYSSGTTGLPKGVCIPHSALIANGAQTAFVRDFHPKYTDDRPGLPERWIGFLPLYHAYGQLYANMLCIKLNVPIYIMSKFGFEDFLSTIERYKITTLQVAPPVLIMLSKRPETLRYNLSSVSAILCGAAPLSRELQIQCEELLNVKISQGWGMTELTCGAISLPVGAADNKPGSVGKLLPNCECKLIGEDGKEVRAGTPGELCIRGPNVCLGYWKNEAATKESLDEEGWFKTGDIGVCNDEGLFWIVDRKKELIKVNGHQVAPAELEAVLLENEHIADAAVVEIKLGGNEWPRAYVVIQEGSKSKITTEDVQKWVAKRVSKHKRLVGGVTFIAEVPKLASGKIMRKVMREWSKRDAAEMERNGTVPAIWSKL
ncbi:Phenylacetyl-CoA ligase epaB [Cladobotryum mycophilum]|uniref:Phenylacetyl-CoA ligase epaB n=1 Tax=Cladobotryum mycophilum TaxID=491253 RepID=A0ABR0SMD7_9HYPO